MGVRPLEAALNTAETRQLAGILGAGGRRRVVAGLGGKTGRLAGLTRIGINELSYRKGQRYIRVVVDHETGRLVWAAEGRCQDTARAFPDALGP